MAEDKHINDMSLQEMFDAAAGGMLKQGGRSVNGVGCAYRGANGMKCAVGFMLADKYYKPDFESSSASAVLEHLGVVDDDKDSLATQLQGVHDRMPIPNWREELAEVAERFHLSPAVLGGGE